MDDLISRKSVIDALSYCQTYLFDTRDHDKKISLEDAEYTIERLPSAQRWIPCSERLPEKGVIVLTQTAKGYMTTNKRVDFYNHGDMPSIHFETWFWGGNYVAWMPLPSPYKEDDDG